MRVICLIIIEIFALKKNNMGASLVYLDKPNKEIEFDVGEDGKVKFAAGGM